MGKEVDFARIDFMRIDLVGVDLVRIDLVGVPLTSYLDVNTRCEFYLMLIMSLYFHLYFR